MIETFCNNQVSENEIMKFNSKWQKSYEKSGYICWSLNVVLQVLVLKFNIRMLGSITQLFRKNHLIVRIAHRKSERIMIIPHKSDIHQEFVILISTVPPVKYRIVLTVNQTAGMLGTQKTELVYASISLCLDIITIHMLCIVLASVIVRHSDHNLF